MDYEAMDKAALHNAQLDLHICPLCTTDLRPVAFFEDTWGCENCHETWWVPKCGHKHPDACDCERGSK